MPRPPPRSIVFVQYGDYAEAFRRLDGGGDETYYAQRYSIEVVSDLVDSQTRVATICCDADRDEDSMLANGVRAINLLSPNGVDERRVREAVMSCAATHLCLRTPLVGVLRRSIDTSSIESILMTLADSFNGSGLRADFRRWKLRRLLNSRRVAAVGNHGINSSRSLQRFGVNPAKIIPWDWPHAITPHQRVPKQAPTGSAWSILFVGTLAESKGLGDVIRAIRWLKDSGVEVRLEYAGRGDNEGFSSLANDLGIARQVKYLGLLKHTEVVPRMRDADLVVIPSRHEYPEGFPMTIYEALSSRTPVVASDHPMYAIHLRDTGAALIYAAGKAESLGAAVRKLMNDPKLYAELSTASAVSWDKLQLPMTWGALVQKWLDPSSDAQLLMGKYSLAHAGAL